MKYSTFFPKTTKREFKDDLSINAVLLTKAGYIDQLMAGSYTLLPLGLRVSENIKEIIREELNKTGALEMLMPLLHPREIWDQSGRWSDPGVKQIMYQFKDIHDKEFGLSFTHEEIVMNLLGKNIQSYKDLPVFVYHFSTKFRNEPRAKSGILRGREFLMKDLYSAHVSEEDMFEYYEKVKIAYINIFERIGFDIRVVEAPGGVFTDKHTHEFQVLTEVGEDKIYYCDKCDFAKNHEIFKGNEGEKCPNCDGTIKKSNSIEVGNIFPLGTKYSKTMNVLYKDKEGVQNPIWFASYGIGVTRVMGALVEVFNDEKGIIWPENISPFKAYLISLGKDKKAKDIEKELEEKGIDVLFDDRDTSAGEKFANADLLGFPFRLVVSEKSGEKIEFKERKNSETTLLELDEIITRIGGEKESEH
jgi:prolyl-tRNA synthetase